jgi:hypothetical protein
MKPLAEFSPWVVLLIFLIALISRLVLKGAEFLTGYGLLAGVGNGRSPLFFN